MGAFGDKLRREREMRGITLADISESTKISKRWLQALEDEQFSQLPGGVFNRGFVRAYARFLGIDEEQAVADYVAASNEQPPPDDKFPLDIHEKKSDSPPLNPKRSVLPILMAVVALVLVVGGWTYWLKHKPQRNSAPDVATKESPPAPRADSPSPSPSPTADVPEKPVEASLNPVSAKTSSPAPDHSQTVVIDSRSDSSAAKGQKSFNIMVKANKDSWVSIVVDGRPIWEGTLTANMQRSIQAGKQLVLKTGNAAGIDVSYNGKPLGALGKEKEVRTLTFNTAGLQQ